MIFKKYFSRDNERSAKALKNIFGSFIIKGMSIAINLALIPLSIKYLNPTKYGVWLTISSIMGWINFFDIGLGHGLRNKLAESIAHNEWDKARSYVSTAYISITVLCLGLFGIFMVVNQYLNWYTLLNIPQDIGENLQYITLIVFSMFAVQFILQLINSILLSNQQSAKVSFNNMLSNLLILVSIALLIQFTSESLFNIAFMFSIIPVIVLAAVNFYYFRFDFKHFSPSIRHFDYNALRDVLHLGVKFFVIQITFIVFFQTSNLLICRYFSPELVTPYNIAFRYFSVITMIFSIIVAPYWSACTEAYAKQDYAWIKHTVNQLLKVWVLVAITAFLMLLFSDYAYRLWVGDTVKVDFKISLFMMLYTVITSFGSIYVMVVNGLGNIRLQMIVGIIGMLAFVPLSYYLAVVLDLGVVGIILSTILCNIYGPLIAPMEVKKLFSRL